MKVKRSKSDRGLIGLAVLGTLAVVLAAFALTFDATSAVAIAARIAERLSWLLPVSIDGAMMVASIAYFALKRLGDAGRYPAFVALAGAGISIWCNGLHATGEPGHVVLTSNERVLVSSIPPLMLALSIHLLVLIVSTLTKRPARPALDAKPAERAGASAPMPAEKIVRRRPAPVAPATAAAPAQKPQEAPAPAARPVSLVKAGLTPRSQTRRSAKPASPVVEAEMIARLAALRDECATAGRKFNREAVKEEFRVSSKKADEYLKALRDASAEHNTSAP